MNLTDTGPLVALVARTDSKHLECVAAARQLPTGPLLTTWPCLTEAMYLVHRTDGWFGQQALWRMLQKEVIQTVDLNWADLFRMHELMDRYHDVPMDFADASLIAVAESRGIKQLFTLDSDFRIYQLADGTMLELTP